MEEGGEVIVEKNNFARKLGSADKKTREKGLSLLVLWLSCQKDVGENELKKIWKGLFYCLWHSDKAHVQGDLINKLAGILESLDSDTSLAFFEVFLTTMRREWGGIDRLRLDKFYRLLRQFLISLFTVFHKSKWDEETIEKYTSALIERSLLADDQYPALGVNLHFVDIFLTELRKFQPLSTGALGLMLQPCYATLASASDKSLLKRVKECVFMPLLEEAQIFVKKLLDGSEVDEKSFGPHVVSLSVGTRFFELASLESTPQANRKVLHDINAEYAKLDKLVAAAGIDLSTLNIGGGCNSGIELAGSRSNVPTRQSARQARKRVTTDLLDLDNGLGKKRKVKDVKDVLTPHDNPAGSPILNLVESSLADVLSFNTKKKNQLCLTCDEKPPTFMRKSGSGKTSQGTVTEKADIEQNDLIFKVVTEKMKGKKKLVPKTAQVRALSKKRGTKCGGVGKDSLVPAVGTGGTGTARIPEQSLVITSFGVANALDGDQVQTGAGDLPDTRGADLSLNVSVDDSVISNLEEKFASIAAETGCEVRSNALSGEATPTEIVGKKKRKRGKPVEVTEPPLSENTSYLGHLLTPLGKLNGVDQTPGSNSTKKKKVKFMLRNNIVWKPNNPLPPQSMRTPPSATPRGSALKKGVPAGPIRITPIRKVGSGSKCRLPSQILSITKQKSARPPKSLSKGPRFARRVRKTPGSL